MAVNICLFEDTSATRLLPLVYFRPVYNLKCGILSLREKAERLLPRSNLILHCRSYLAEHMRIRNPKLSVNVLPSGDTLFVNGRTILDENLVHELSRERGDRVFQNGDDVVAAHVQAGTLARMQQGFNDALQPEYFSGLPRTNVEARVIAYPWDLVRHNGDELVRDFGRLMKTVKGKRIRGTISKGAFTEGRNNIFIGEGATIKPGVVLDAKEGPIYIGKKARIFPNACIIGPSSVGEQSWIKVGAQIYENTSIGPLSKVGGEVEGTIIHGYSNKQHGGFLGHAYLGAWINLGADTNNSDLKNNYGTVRVTVGNEQIDTGMQFFGLTMGDHSKSAINSMFNTGTVVGVSSNIFGSGFPPKYVPSFSWGAAGETFTTFSVDKAIEVARRVMSRRKVDLTAAEERLFRKIFELTSAERRRQGMPG